jgi:hypothetical protein
MVGRHRRPVAPCDGARAALVTWLRDVLDEDGRSDASLADDIQYDRSSVSRALSGRVMPSQPLGAWGRPIDKKLSMSCSCATLGCDPLRS